MAGQSSFNGVFNQLGYSALLLLNGISKIFNLDTCAIIQICKNPNLGVYLSCNLDLKISKICLTDISLVEAELNGYPKSEVIQKLQHVLGAQVEVAEVTTDMLLMAQQWEKKLPLLHSGDSSIMAYSLATSSTLITYDNDLLKCCKIAGVNCINPTLMMKTQFTIPKRLQKIKHRTVSGTKKLLRNLKNKHKATVAAAAGGY